MDAPDNDLAIAGAKMPAPTAEETPLIAFVAAPPPTFLDLRPINVDGADVPAAEVDAEPEIATPAPASAMMTPAETAMAIPTRASVRL